MAEEQIRSQIEDFEQAKRSVASELDAEMLSWDFSKMMEEFKRAIDTNSPQGDGKNRKSVRFFSRHHLNMHGSRFNEVRAWVNGRSAMSTDNIQLVLQTLKQLRDGNFEEKKEEVKKVAQKIVKERPSRERGTSGAARKLVDHTITLFNSLVGLIIETGVKPSDVYDGDRMQICDALQRTCKAFGIKAVFPEPDMTHSQPVTSEDLQELGLPSKRRKGL